MLRTIGMMSGTSLDGVDAAWVETDGERIGRLGPRLTLPYDDGPRRDLGELLDRANAARAGVGPAVRRAGRPGPPWPLRAAGGLRGALREGRARAGAAAAGNGLPPD